MQNHENVLNYKEEAFLEENLFVGESDEIVPNCEGGPCNFLYRETYE